MWWPLTQMTLFYFKKKKMNSVLSLIVKTHKASIQLRRMNHEQIQNTLLSLANALEKNRSRILEANAKDLSKQNPDNPRNDRLTLNEQRVINIANAIRNVSKLPDPCGKVLEKRTLHNGLQLEKISVSLG